MIHFNRPYMTGLETEYIRKAVENDIRDGRVRAGTNATQVATVCMAIWDGIVHARIAKVLLCDMEDTLRKSYGAVMNSIRA